MSGAGNWWAEAEFVKLGPAPLPAVYDIENELNAALPE